jgi:uncharacterized protein YjgD (DUF1641 family)
MNEKIQALMDKVAENKQGIAKAMLVVASAALGTVIGAIIGGIDYDVESDFETLTPDVLDTVE